jgi:TRAP-type C4-dicarboxylate transport system permease small subunit
MKPGKIVDVVIPNFCAGLLFLMTFFTFLQIVLRQFFSIGLPWVDEVTRFCMVWVGLFGSIWITKNNQHLNVGIRLHEKFSNKRMVCLIDGFFCLFVSAVSSVVAYHTAKFAFTSMDVSSLSLEWLKLGYVFIAVPIAMAALSYYYLISGVKYFFSCTRKTTTRGN